MDQVSLPMRIALLVVLAFAGLWFAALRPKPPTTEPVATPTPAPKTADAVTSAPKKAEKAAAQANGSAAAKEAAAGDAAPAAAKADETAKAAPAKPASESAAKTAAPAEPAAPAKPAADAKPAPLQRVLDDLEAKRTTVLLFWDRRASDDREVRRAVAGIDRHDGKVRVHVQPISKVGLFEPVTRNVPVVTSPTVLVIGKDRRARAVQGLTVTGELDELVVKALAGR